MENDEIREQPEAEQANVLNVTESESADSESGSQKAGADMEKFGKFKSAEALYEAYQNLQAEFTRKCQKLSEFEKDKTQLSKPSQQQIEDDLNKFLVKNTEAQNYSEQLKEKVKEEKGSTFEDAWAKIVMEEMASKDTQKFNSPIFKKYVFDDEMLKNKVIEIYMKELNEKRPPILISSEGQRAAKQEPAAPTSLKEAKRLMEEMFS